MFLCDFTTWTYTIYIMNKNGDIHRHNNVSYTSTSRLSALFKNSKCALMVEDKMKTYWIYYYETPESTKKG